MQVKKYKNAKKNKTYKKLLAITLVFVAIIGLGCYGVIKASDYVAERELEIWQAGYEQGYWDGGIEATTPSVEPKIEPVKASTYRADKDTILKELAKIESRSGKVRKLMDTNGKYSLGLYHFQARTVKDMYKRYYKKNITIEEAVEIAHNDELATQLAYDAIFVKKEKWHWHNSMVKLQAKGLLTYK